MKEEAKKEERGVGAPPLQRRLKKAEDRFGFGGIALAPVNVQLAMGPVGLSSVKRFELQIQRWESGTWRLSNSNSDWRGVKHESLGQERGRYKPVKGEKGAGRVRRVRGEPRP